MITKSEKTEPSPAMFLDHTAFTQCRHGEMPTKEMNDGIAPPSVPQPWSDLMSQREAMLVRAQADSN